METPRYRLSLYEGLLALQTAGHFPDLPALPASIVGANLVHLCATAFGEDVSRCILSCHLFTAATTQRNSLVSHDRDPVGCLHVRHRVLHGSYAGLVKIKLLYSLS